MRQHVFVPGVIEEATCVCVCVETHVKKKLEKHLNEILKKPLRKRGQNALRWNVELMRIRCSTLTYDRIRMSIEA